MIRDKLMKELIQKEPITPFTDRVNELYTKLNVSTIIVIGGSGEYLFIADKIYMMSDFIINDVTLQTKSISEKYQVSPELPPPAEWVYNRTLLSERFSSYPEGSGSECLKVSDMGYIIIGDEQIDVRGLHNIITTNQLFALSFILRQLEVTNNDYEVNIEKHLDKLYQMIENEGLDCVYSGYFTSCERFLDLPRKIEVISAINRMRKVTFRIEGENTK